MFHYQKHFCKKIAFWGAIISATGFTSPCSANVVREHKSNQIDLSTIPAITLQLHTNGTIQTNYAKLRGETNYGLWIALDSVSNKIYYKMLQENNGPQVFAVEPTMQKIKDYIDQNENLIKNTLSDIINFESTKYYFTLIKKYLSETRTLKLSDINAQLLHVGTRKLPQKANSTHVELKLDKYINQYSASIESNISLWQKKYNISKENTAEMNHILQTLQQYIALHPLQNGDSKLSFDIENSPCYYDFSNHYPYCDEWQKPYIIQFAKIYHTFDKNIFYKKNTPTEYNSTLGFFLYLPPIAKQYGNKKVIDSLFEKFDNIEPFLKTSLRKNILQPNASDRIKERANDFVTTIINEVKKQQEKLNHEIDKVCNKIKKILG